MLLSMTGFGEAHCQEDSLIVAIEARTINNRYFKLNVRLPDGYGALEAPIEAAVRRHVRRGTVQLQMRIERAATPDDYQVDAEILAGYHRQLTELSKTLNLSDAVRVDALLPLPGVVVDRSSSKADVSEDWPVVERTLNEALEQLARMRAEEGTAIAADLTTNCQAVSERLDQIERLAPRVVEGYRQRLSERVSRAMEELNVQVDSSDLIRDVSLFAERSDISEEIVRLRSHLAQFQDTMALAESSGRKLDFVTQEMFRESNTIGSKANDVEIARHVVDVKAAIERIREQVQNVE